ncbi:MAG: phage regulatory CII family protein, partial [Opitutaceae bacterium]
LESVGLGAGHRRNPSAAGRLFWGDCVLPELWTACAIMDSHELIKDVLKKTSAKQISSEIGLSLSLVYKWAEPPADGSGANNPLDRIAQLLRATGDERIARWVCERAGGFFIRNPPVGPHVAQLVPEMNQIVQEFADMLHVIAAAASDSTITPAESKSIRARWEELKSVTEGFVREAEAGDFSARHAKKN